MNAKIPYAQRTLGYEPEKYTCKDCKYFENGCKRVDGKKVNFAKTTFICEAFGDYICSDFVFKDSRIYGIRNWIDFETYWKEFQENWFPRRNLDTYNVYFVLNNNQDVRYGVRIKDYIYGNMFSGNRLNAVEKMYYRQTRNPNHSGYELVREEINGVDV